MKSQIKKIIAISSKNKFLTFFILVFIFYFILVPTLNNAQTEVHPELLKLTNCKDPSWLNSQFSSKNSSTDCPSLVDVYFSLSGIDLVTERRIDAKIQLFPSGDYGGAVANGGWTAKSIELTYEGSGETNWQLLSNTLVGSRAVEIGLSNQEALYRYPFDTYSTTWSSRLEDDVEGNPIPIVMSASQRNIEGYVVEIFPNSSSDPIKSQRDAFLNGKYEINIVIKRSPASIFLTVMLGFIMLAGAIASLLMTSYILVRKRPPSLASLGWLATFLFALIEIRQNLPGLPPLGIGFDSFITFPVIIIMMLAMLITGLNWIGRDDWDIKNVDRK